MTMDLGEITDAELLNVMADGAKQVCDHALKKWIANDYRMDDPTRQAYIARWSEIRRSISPFRKTILAALAAYKGAA